MKTENIVKRLKENGFSCEVGDFRTFRGNFRIRIGLDVKKHQCSIDCVNFCNKYQIFGVRIGNYFYTGYTEGV